MTCLRPPLPLPARDYNIAGNSRFNVPVGPEFGLTPGTRFSAVVESLGATPAQVALSWIVRQEGVIAIPKAGHVDRVRENRGALEVRLAPDDLRAIDEAFPPPSGKTPLEMI